MLASPVTISEGACDLLYATLVSGTAAVVADFTATRFCDCASLRRLLAIQQRAAAQGVKLPSLRGAGGPAGSRPGSRGE